MSDRQKALVALHIGGLALFSFGLVRSVIAGDLSDAVVSALFLLMVVSLLVRHTFGEPVQASRRKALLLRVASSVGGLAIGTIVAGAAVLATIEAGQASGGERILYVVAAVFFYLLAALLIVGVIVGSRVRRWVKDRESVNKSANETG